MGSFADFHKEENAKIREEKKGEFETRIEKIFDYGGMMETKTIQLYDNKIVTIKRVQMKEVGEIIFVPEGPEYENKGIHYWEDTSKRRLKRTWDIMPHNEKNNIARVKLRRYMALLGNTQLRKRVFGF